MQITSLFQAVVATIQSGGAGSQDVVTISGTYSGDTTFNGGAGIDTFTISAGAGSHTFTGGAQFTNDFVKIQAGFTGSVDWTDFTPGNYIIGNSPNGDAIIIDIEGVTTFTQVGEELRFTNGAQQFTITIGSTANAFAGSIRDANGVRYDASDRLNIAPLETANTGAGTATDPRIWTLAQRDIFGGNELQIKVTDRDATPFSDDFDLIDFSDITSQAFVNLTPDMQNKLVEVKGQSVSILPSGGGDARISALPDGIEGAIGTSGTDVFYLNNEGTDNIVKGGGNLDYYFVVGGDGDHVIDDSMGNDKLTISGFSGGSVTWNNFGDGDIISVLHPQNAMMNFLPSATYTRGDNSITLMNGDDILTIDLGTYDVLGEEVMVMGADFIDDRIPSDTPRATFEITAATTFSPSGALPSGDSLQVNLDAQDTEAVAALNTYLNLGLTSAETTSGKDTATGILIDRATASHEGDFVFANFSDTTVSFAAIDGFDVLDVKPLDQFRETANFPTSVIANKIQVSELGSRSTVRSYETDKFEGIRGGEGSDVFVASEDITNFLSGGAGRDVFIVLDTTAADKGHVLAGGAFTDYYYIAGGSGHVVDDIASGGNDILTITGNAGNIYANLGAGNDTINIDAGSGHDINGGDGNNTFNINAGSGHELQGGSGADRYIVGANYEDAGFSVDNFLGSDRIDLSAIAGGAVVTSDMNRIATVTGNGGISFTITNMSGMFESADFIGATFNAGEAGSDSGFLEFSEVQLDFSSADLGSDGRWSVDSALTYQVGSDFTLVWADAAEAIDTQAELQAAFGSQFSAAEIDGNLHLSFADGADIVLDKADAFNADTDDSGDLSFQEFIDAIPTISFDIG